MAETIVVSAVEWIGSLLIQEGSTLIGVEDEVERIQQKLQILREYLQDADSNPGVEVRSLTVRVRKLAYDAEDLIDTYILKIVPKTRLTLNHIHRNWLVRFARFVYKSPFTYKLGKDIQVLLSDMSEVTEKLEKQEVQRTSHVREMRTLRQKASYPYDEGDYVVGLEKDIQKLVQVLMGQGKDQDIHLVGIMGMGGSGKTTLARKLFNHPYVKECFDCWAWVLVSQQWSTQHMLSEILRQVAGPSGLHYMKSDKYITTEELVDKLRNILEKKSYLVVLDDVWRREPLQDIFPALPYSKGSKIIITSRNQQIVQLEMPQSSYIYEPRPLDEDQGWQLLRKFSLSHRISDDSNQMDMPSFEQLGKEMLKQCQGLPLAIVALAGILSTKASIGEWQQVSRVVRARVMEGMGRRVYDRVGDLLALSYDDLPYYLKPCFLHLGLFPEDCQIPTGMLTRMWVAEGLVTPHEDMFPEDVAMQHLEELSHCFMVQVVKTNFKGNIKAVRLHDLLRSLCIKKAKEQGFLNIYTSIEGHVAIDASALMFKPRRAALHSRSSPIPTQASNLRSLIRLTQSSVSHTAYIHKDMLNMKSILQNFKLLRLLNLFGIKTVSGTLPTQIGSLIHLRYLGLCATNINKLPTSIGNLRNLLSLDYRNVDVDDNSPVTIPNTLSKLVLLRHLFLPVECTWSVQGLQLRAIRNLRILWGVKQGETGYWLSEEVQELSTTLKKLKIFVSRKVDLVAAFKCPSLLHDGLHTFHCELRGDIALRDVEPLSNKHHLHKLILIGEIQMKLSLLLPAHLVVLELRDSMLNEEHAINDIGALTHLKLLRMVNSYGGSILACKPGSFPQLEELYLENLHNLNMWEIEKGAIPCLKKLEIVRCRQLQEFPEGLDFITKLKQFEFVEMPTRFCQKAFECGWSQQGLRLPHNYGAIMKRFKTELDLSSIRKIYERLTAGILIDQGNKIYWVAERDGSYNNCFMMYAKELSVRCWTWPQPFMRIREDRRRPYDEPMQWFSGYDQDLWEMKEIAERDSRDSVLITVAKLKSQVDLLRILGKLNSEDLSPRVTYEVNFVIMLQGPGSGLEMSAECTLTLPSGTISKREENADDKPRDEWIQVLVGEFDTSPENIGQVEFSIDCDWSGLMIKGVAIQPKRL